MHRPPSEAGELILRALADADSPALTLAELQERSGLPDDTVHDNVKQLRKAGMVQTSKDGHGTVWVSLCEE